MPTDLRRVAGSKVQALAKHVTSDAECKRLFGSNWDTKLLPGVVISAVSKTLPGRSRASWLIVARYVVTGQREKEVELNSRSVKLAPTDPPPPAAATDPPPPAATDPPPPPPTNPQSTIVTGTQTNPAPPTVPPATNPPPATVPPAAIPGINAPLPRIPEGRSTEPVAICHEKQWFEWDRNARVPGNIAFRQWKAIDPLGNHIYPGSGAARSMSQLEYFLLLFSPNQLDALVTHTNEQLSRKNLRKTTKGEMLKFLGVVILITRFKCKDRRELWKSATDFKYVPAAGLARTGMTRHRFEQLWVNQRWAHQPPTRPEGMSHEAHRWMLVGGHVDRFNKWRATNFVPSDLICIDESMSRWYGQGGHWINLGLPQYVAIDRKPENGCEIQDAACGRSSVMLSLKLVKSAESEDAHVAEDEEGLPHGFLVMKELLTPWVGTGVRVVCADSYFASVKATEELNKLGFRFIGVVKTATKKFPMAYLRGLEMEGRGALRAVESKDGEGGATDMLAFVWVDRERRYFVCNGAGLEGAPPIYRSRWRQVDETPDADSETVQLEIEQPAACNVYYSVCGKIDQVNRQRQDDLEIERLLRTHNWAIRVNMSIFGIAVVDAYNVFFQCCGDDRQESQGDFYTLLAEELIDNIYDTRTRRSPNEDGGVARRSTTPHLTPTRKKRKRRDGTQTNHSVQGNCKICSKSTSWICSECSHPDDIAASEVWICHSKNGGRQCFATHCIDEHN